MPRTEAMTVLAPRPGQFARTTQAVQRSRRQPKLQRLGGLVLRDLDRLDVQALSGTASARYPFWSPDGNWIGYTTAGNFELCKRIDFRAYDPPQRPWC